MYISVNPKFCIALHLHSDANSLVAAEIFRIITSSGRVLRVVLVVQTCEDTVIVFFFDLLGLHNWLF